MRWRLITLRPIGLFMSSGRSSEPSPSTFGVPHTTARTVQASRLSLVADLYIRVRPAREADADAIGETLAAAWTAAYDHIFDASFLASAAESRRRDAPTRCRASSSVPALYWLSSEKTRSSGSHTRVPKAPVGN
jgi:hypothetical protein